jgi:hypothetical protein
MFANDLKTPWYSQDGQTATDLSMGIYGQRACRKSLRQKDRTTKIGIAILILLTMLGVAPSLAWANGSLPSDRPAPSEAPVTQNTSVSPPEARPHTASAGNGYILMIHSTFEPVSTLDRVETGSVRVDQAKKGLEYGSGALGATRNGDSIIFHAIPYLAATVYPAVVNHPQLEVDGVGSDRRLMLQPNLPADTDAICQFETHWKGHEGPVEACSVYKVPVREFDGMNVVTLTLHFIDAGGPQEEIHNVAIHTLLHAAIEDAPIDLKAIDAATIVPTSLIMENVIDTQRSAAWHCSIAAF